MLIAILFRFANFKNANCGNHISSRPQNLDFVGQNYVFTFAKRHPLTTVRFGKQVMVKLPFWPKTQILAH